MKDRHYFEPKILWEKAAEAASRDRKIMGGSYEIRLFFEDFDDFLVFTPHGNVQAKGRDEHHVYVRPWSKCQFRATGAADLLKNHAENIEVIEIKGCGNDYSRLFDSYDAFLSFLGFPRQLDLLV